MSHLESLNFLAQALLCPTDRSPLSVELNKTVELNKSVKLNKTVEQDKVVSKNRPNGFPNDLGIPWIYRSPELQISQWKNKIQNVANYYTERSKLTQNELRGVDLLKSTQTRLSELEKAYLDSANKFNELAGQFTTHEPVGLTEKSFFEKVPRQQTVMAYHQTLFRDWAWGQKEIEIQLSHIKDYFKNTQKLLVLGAGACGLPIALHNSTQIESTLAIDINPVLLSTVAQMLNGKAQDWIEFPTLPLQNCAVHHQLQIPKIRSGFHLALADAQDLAINDDFFDGLLTPWFIDIVPRDFCELAAHFNLCLKRGGTWVNIGPLAFEKNRISQNYSSEEVKEILEVSGFRVLQLKQITLPYMQSPYSGLGREDKIIMFHAVKESSAKRPKRYSYLPEWLTDSSQPIPQSQEIRDHQLKSKIYAQVLACVDGKTSLKQIAKLYAQQYQVSEDIARDSLIVFFNNIFEQIVFREY